MFWVFFFNDLQKENSSSSFTVFYLLIKTNPSHLGSDFLQGLRYHRLCGFDIGNAAVLFRLASSQLLFFPAAAVHGATWEMSGGKKTQ